MIPEEMDENARKVSWLCNTCNQMIYAGFLDETDEVDPYLPSSCPHSTKCFVLAEVMALAPVENSQEHPL